MNSQLILTLEHAAKEVRSLEARAKQYLYDEGNNEKYTELLTEKAHLLHKLFDSVKGHISHMEPHQQAYIQDVLGGMSYSAEKALNLQSIFYMSALLYPEDYKEGDKNDLERCIDHLRSFS